MTPSIKLIFAILGISSAFLLFSIGMLVNLANQNQEDRGFAFGILLTSSIILLPIFFFILEFYGLLSGAN